MAEYIERQAAIDAVHEEFDGCTVWDASGERTADEFESIIDRVPAADVAPIVFCIDCMYHCYDKVVDEHWCNHGIMAGEVTPDFYCAYGRREE